MKRLAIFAHYDKKNSINAYVLYYLKELKKVVDNIVFVSDSEVSDQELKKIQPYVVHAITGRHGEYDFGSYKRGYFYAKENNLLNDCEELIFANDSCYAPLFPFEEMFAKMSQKDVDFWGVTENSNGYNPSLQSKNHVQSYFLVFKSQIFKHECFDEFINSIKKQETKKQIIDKYEIGLSEYLLEKNFKYDVYCKVSKKKSGAFIFNYKELIKKDRNPFLKRSIVLYKNAKKTYPFFLKKFMESYTDYDFDFINEDRKNNDVKLSFIIHIDYIVSSFLHAVKTFREHIISIRLKKEYKRISIFSKTVYEQYDNKD